jgi:hypothetical protein
MSNTPSVYEELNPLRGLLGPEQYLVRQLGHESTRAAYTAAARNAMNLAFQTAEALSRISPYEATDVPLSLWEPSPTGVGPRLAARMAAANPAAIPMTAPSTRLAEQLAMIPMALPPGRARGAAGAAQAPPRTFRVSPEGVVEEAAPAAAAGGKKGYEFLRGWKAMKGEWSRLGEEALAAGKKPGYLGRGLKSLKAGASKGVGLKGGLALIAAEALARGMVVPALSETGHGQAARAVQSAFNPAAMLVASLIGPEAIPVAMAIMGLKGWFLDKPLNAPPSLQKRIDTTMAWLEENADPSISGPAKAQYELLKSYYQKLGLWNDERRAQVIQTVLEPALQEAIAQAAKPQAAPPDALAAQALIASALAPYAQRAAERQIQLAGGGPYDRQIAALAGQLADWTALAQAATPVLADIQSRIDEMQRQLARGGGAGTVLEQILAGQGAGGTSLIPVG